MKDLVYTGDLKTKRDRVEGLLKREDWVGSHCRNDDNFLCLYYIYEYHCDMDLAIHPLMDVLDLLRYAKELPNLADIKRIRAYFQNTKQKYLSDEQVQKMRHLSRGALPISSAGLS